MSKPITIYNIADLPREARLHEGRMKRYSLRTQHAQIVFGEITPQPRARQGNHREPHDHPFDMLLVVLKGTMMQDVEGIEYELKAGSATVVPAYYMHRGYAYGDEPAVLFEVFAPARKDYIDLVEYQKEFRDKGADWVKEGTFTTNPFTGNNPNAGRLPVYQRADVPRESKLHQGRMRRYSIRTKHAQVVWADITPQPKGQQGHHRKPHDHPHDMMLIVQKGAMRMEIGGTEYDMPAGSAVVIPPLVMHRGYALGDETTSIMEIFSPVRRDYIHLVSYQKEKFDDNGVEWVKPGLDSWNSPPT
ncbi:MAG TPA: cupin domain-containing protein [Stellaceae bacterium]|nr:cupin domain-containing protein [Stellaceae bacterium]